MSEILPRVSGRMVLHAGQLGLIGGFVVAMLCIVVGGAVAYPYWQVLGSTSVPLANLLPTPVAQSWVFADSSKVAGVATDGSILASHQEVQRRVAAVVAQNSDVDMSVSIQWLSDGHIVGLDDTDVYTAASTTKILTACYVLSQIDKGKASLMQRVDGQTVQSLLQQMVNQSDNSAWETLADQFSWTDQQQYARTLGLQSYNYQGNEIDAHDLAQLLGLMYQGQLFRQDLTKMLLGWMQQTNEERLIPAAIPSGMTIYHKYGWIDDNVHDTAIIDTGSEKVVLVILTRGKTNFDTRADVMHQVVRAVLGKS